MPTAVARLRLRTLPAGIGMTKARSAWRSSTLGGKPVTLVDVKEWDYNWQELYFLREPIKVKAGTKFTVEAVYDNSTANPRNPNRPPKIILPGEQTTNEMCFVFLGATSDEPGRIRFGPPGGKPFERPRAEETTEP